MADSGRNNPPDKPAGDGSAPVRGRCPRCREERELVPRAQRRTRHALPALLSPLEVVQPHACPVCGCEVKSTVWIAPTDASPVRARPVGGTQAVARRGMLMRFDGSGVSMDYPGVARDGEDTLFPAHEGALGAGRAIDRYGDPDQMAEFAAEYLKRSGAIMPEGGLPRRVSEMMPALHLLINAAELALKADLVRSEKDSGGHVLTTLYGRLDGAHRDEVERRFASAGPNADLVALGHPPVAVDSVLQVYGTGFGWSPAYVETRYYAEPTTKIREASARGGNLVKRTPYPIFLPHAVAAMLESYAYFSGVERLSRLGAVVGLGTRDKVNDNHGDWGLVPASLGLVVLRVAQQVATDEGGAEREAFRRFVAGRPPAYRTEWMYGGGRLLFYRVREPPPDGETEIDGLACRVWSSGRLGLHARDLYRLADVLEDGTGVFDPSPSRSVST